MSDQGTPSTLESLRGSFSKLAAFVSGLSRPALTLTEAEVRYAARFELARDVEDILARRNRALFVDAAAASTAAPAVARILAEELGWSDTRRRERTAAFVDLAQGFMAGPG